MSFTVKDIFPPLDLSKDELGKHRMNVGMGIRDSWIDLHKTPPKKVEEDGVGSIWVLLMAVQVLTRGFGVE